MTVAKPQATSRRKVLLYPGEDGYFVVEVPSLPGCISQGKTREEALANI
jgi:predicted RNase H-like HicB family nuclease